jgi:hypothetical protein
MFIAPNVGDDLVSDLMSCRRVGNRRSIGMLGRRRLDYVKQVASIIIAFALMRSRTSNIRRVEHAAIPLIYAGEISGFG